MTSFSPVVSTAQTTEPRDCLKLRMENGWSRAEFRQCKLEESQKRVDALNADTARLDVEFAKMRDWLRARGLDVNDTGHITDPKGRTLAQIETSNAALAAGNADLAAGNAALRADIKSLRLSIQTSRAEYRQILQEFERSILQGQ